MANFKPKRAGAAPCGSLRQHGFLVGTWMHTCCECGPSSDVIRVSSHDDSSINIDMIIIIS